MSEGTRKEDDSAKDSTSPRPVHSDGNQEVFYIPESRDIKGKQKVYHNEKPIVCCLVLLSTGINREEYRRIGIAELEDLDGFENVPEKVVTIV